MQQSAGVLAQIELAMGELSVSEGKVARYVVNHPKKVLSMTIHELARQSETSSAAVVRLCRTLGIDGFPNLKMQLSAESALQAPGGFLDVKANENLDVILDKTLNNFLQSINDTARQLDRLDLEQAVRMLARAETVFVYGGGGSSLIAQDIAQKWRRLGKVAYNISDRHELLISLAASPEKAVFWCISASGETPDLIRMIKSAKSLGVKTLGLTRVGNNTVSRLVDVSLRTARVPESKIRSSGTQTRIAQLLIVDTLYLTFASAEYEDMVRKRERITRTLSELD